MKYNIDGKSLETLNWEGVGRKHYVIVLNK